MDKLWLTFSASTVDHVTRNINVKINNKECRGANFRINTTKCVGLLYIIYHTIKMNNAESPTNVSQMLHYAKIYTESLVNHLWHSSNFKLL